MKGCCRARGRTRGIAYSAKWILKSTRASKSKDHKSDGAGEKRRLKMGGLNNNGQVRSDPRADDWPRLLRVGVNTEIRYKADFANDAKARSSLTYNYTVNELMLEELAAEIGQHHNICNPCFNGNKFHRKKEFCQSADYIAIDIDNDQEVDELDARGNKVLDARGKPKKIKARCADEDYFSFEAALADPFTRTHAGLIYPTPSDTPEWNRFRILFPTPHRMLVSWFKDKDRLSAQTQFERFFDETARLLIFKYGSDESCKDCSRFFYGTNQPDKVVILGGYLTPDTINRLREEYKAAHPKPEAQEFKAALNIDINSANAQERKEKYGERALMVAKQQIEQATMGHKNKTRARMAYLIGGYVAGGLLDEDTALAELESSVRANTDNFNKSWKTVDKCFAEGMSDPITFEDCERWRAQYTSSDTVDEEEETIVAPDGEIIDLNDDQVITNNATLEGHLRKILAHASSFTRARMMMAATLGFKKLPWRLLNAILAYERNKLSVKTITNDMMLALYAKNGDRAASESTLFRDKKKLWKEQGRIGVEIVWYMQGYERLEVGQKFGEGERVGSRYKCHLDRWTLEAIALAIEKKGSYRLKDAEIKAACEEIAKNVPRYKAEDSKPAKPELDSEAIGEKIHKGAEISLERLVPKFHEAWDMLGLTVGHRHIRTKGILRLLGTKLLKGADASTTSGKRQRKKSQSEIRETVNTFVGEILDDASPVKDYAKGAKSPPFVRTAYKKHGEIDTSEAGLHTSERSAYKGVILTPFGKLYATNEESTSYGWTVESEGMSIELQRIDRRRQEIRLRFAEIQPADGRVFVDPANSDEVIRLAEELDELDRQEAALLVGEFYPAIVPSGPDPLVDGLLEDDQMESYV
jgi:hypothetical protein